MNTENKFEWTDSLVEEFLNEGENVNYDWKKSIEKFKKSKLAPPTKERIEIRREIRFVDELFSNEIIIEFNKEISKDKFPEIKQAITAALNEDTLTETPQQQTSVVTDNSDVDCLSLKDLKEIDHAGNGQVLMITIDKINAKIKEKLKQHPKINIKEEDKEVLFTTEDGVGMREGDIWFTVNKHLFALHPHDENKNETWGNKNYVYFSTKELAEQYILSHKPILSLNDCAIGIPKDLFNKLEIIAKEKIKQ